LGREGEDEAWEERSGGGGGGEVRREPIESIAKSLNRRVGVGDDRLPGPMTLTSQEAAAATSAALTTSRSYSDYILYALRAAVLRCAEWEC